MTERRTGGEAQAQALYQLLEDMDSSGITPEFVVGLEEMEVVQRAITNSSLASGENVQIGARLESLEVGLKDLGAKIGNLSLVPISSVPVKVSSTNHAPNIVVSDMEKNSFAQITAKGLGVPKTNGSKQRSNSQ